VITLSVIAFNDVPADGTLAAQFDELGGSIGRADTNQLVLPDPDRTISRVAAQVVYRNGNWAIVDRGSNPIVVNGQALGSGREAPLAPGDRVRIGGYELVVRTGGTLAGGRHVPADPFADLLGPGTGASPAAAPQSGSGASRRSAAPIDPLDPLAAFGVGAPPPAPRGAPTAAPRAPAVPAGIPTDWDPFAPPSVAPGAAAAPAPRNPLGLDIGPGAPAPLVPGLAAPAAAPSSLDQLFGLGPSTGGDPLANSLLDAPAANPNMAADADPLQSLRSAPKATAATEQDNLSDLNRPFIPNTLIRPAAPSPAAVFPPPVPAVPPPAVSGAVMSWDRDAASHTIIHAPAPAAPPARAPLLPDDVPLVPTGMAPSLSAGPRPGVPEPLAGPAPAALAPSTKTPAAAAPAAVPEAERAPQAVQAGATPAAGDADTQALLAALQRGLGPAAGEVQRLTPELMQLLGELLYESAAGTVHLLQARAAFKSELKAQPTVIVAQKNNPLKFSPTPEVALKHLLSPPTRGFIAAGPAMKDAYNDLRAHQIGFVAGMQAALEGVLQRFDPADLESRLTARSVLHTVLPASRKAKMWEVFVEHYTRIRADASDDFHSLFGKAFLAAYEAQLDRLHEDKPS